jgi:protein gp37
MSDKSGIEWTDATWTVVQGCDPVSPGCEHCYVPRLLRRLEANPNPKAAAPRGLVEAHTNAAGKTRLRFTGEVALREDRLTWPLQWRAPRMIFVPSHGDIFHKDVPDEFIDRILAVMALCPQHRFQVLTKRAERMREYFGNVRVAYRIWRRADVIACELNLPEHHPSNKYLSAGGARATIPLPNVWLGVSAERQQEADERIPHLLQTPAAIRFVSAEPLLGPIDLLNLRPGGGHLNTLTGRATEAPGDIQSKTVVGPHLDWVIVGGESGPSARPMHPDWARGLRDQCAAAGVAFFFKQWGEYLPVGQYLPGYGKVHGATAVKPGRMKLHYGGTSQQEPQHAFAERGVGIASTGDGRLAFRVGKKAAGRMLDGREHNEFPVAAASSSAVRDAAAMETNP